MIEEKWTRGEELLFLCVVLFAIALCLPFLYEPLYAATYGTLKSNQARVIDATEPAICLSETDINCISNQGLDWYMRATRASKLSQFYTSGGSGIGAIVTFSHQDTTNSTGTPYMVLNDANAIGLTSVRPSFPNGVDLGGVFAGVGGTHVGSQQNNVVAAATAFTIVNTDDTDATNWQIYGTGEMKWGVSGALADTNLYRSAANTLATDDSFDVGTDLLFSNGAGTGLAYGSMYSVSDMAVTMTTQNVWYEIDVATAWVTGKLNNCTFTDPYITVTNAGTYLVTWNIVGRIGTANQVIEVGIMLDQTATDNPSHGSAGVQGEGRGAVEYLNSARRLGTAGSAIMQLTASQKVSLAVRNTSSDARVITVSKGNLKVVQIGG